MVTERQNEILNLVVDILPRPTNQSVQKRYKMSFNPVVRPSETTWLPSKARVARESPHFEWPHAQPTGFQYFRSELARFRVD